MTDLEHALRDTLVAAEHAAPVPPGLSERLLAGVSARPSGRVVPFRPRSSVRRVLPPLLAAAAVVAAVVTTVAVRTTAHQPPAKPVPNPAPSLPTVPFPTGFQATNVDFSDATHGWAIGDAHCGPASRALRPPAPAMCAAVLRTSDGGVHWQALPAPKGISSAVQCGRPATDCADQVAVADDRHAYLWGPSRLFVTADGGRTWRSSAQATTTLVVVGGQVLRTEARSTGANADDRLLASPLDGSRWTDVTPAAFGATHGDVLLARSGSAVIAVVGARGGHGAAAFGSTDAGHSWRRVVPQVCPAGRPYDLSASADGSAAVVCDDGSGPRATEFLVDGTAFVPVPLPGVDGGDRVVELQAVEHGVLLARVGNRTPGHTFYRSTDNGDHWTQVGTDDATQTVFEWQLLDARHGYRLQPFGAGLLVTSDGGRTWTPRPFRP
ncbi:MAG: WD40/YVTN/BNR-like repeat-containing protein [Jatrophihabitans sp.]|uniref:WD40/YVTN/BNR-like repeat-containing protein n=1 Tax=Jatrophihabitans sp. TaxID=1932789 RepID=UPI003F7E6785